MNLFADASAERVVGEASVFYLLSQTAASEIHAFNPNAKILVMIRNPVDLLASHHSQIVYEGYETERDFQRALALEPVRKSADGTEAVYHRRVRHYRDVAALSAQIERFVARFGWDRIHVVVYEDFRRDPLAAYREVLAFLGVDTAFRPTLRVHNANKVPRNAWLRTFLRNTPRWVTRTARVVLPSPTLREGVKTRLKRANTRTAPRAVVPARTRWALAEEFAPEVDRLGRLIGRDLQHWTVLDQQGELETPGPAAASAHVS
jgi:hypothetical protein